jgi:pimeloyl-ACP methyl ester carboxylesterase
MYVEHLRIPVGAGSLHAERVGRGGPPVLLIHGFGTCAFLWRRLAPALAMAGYTAIAVDLLGHGESDRPGEASYSLEAQAEYLARVIAALRLPAITVVGQDIGALVGLLLAARQGVRIESLVLLSPPDPDDLPGADIRMLQRASARMVLSANTLFGAQPVLDALLRAAVQQPEHMPDLLVARYLAPFVGPDGIAQLLQRASAIELSPEGRERLTTAAVPVLVIEGEGDGPRPSLSWPKMLPAAVVTVDRPTGVGRLVAEDAPDLLESRLMAWLGTQRNAAVSRLSHEGGESDSR